MQKAIGKGFERYQFDSLGELAQFLQDTPRKWCANQSESAPARDSWDLNVGYDEAWKLARGGWLDGAARIKKALKLLPPATPRPVNRNDFYGHMPHVPRFCAGAPDSMIRHDRKATNDMGRVLTVIVPIDAPSMAAAEHMCNFGTGLAHYIANLEATGTRVEVIGAIVGQVGSVRESHAWHIKRASQPLDLPVLAFAVAHPAMFRRIGFALLERLEAREKPGYGAPMACVLSDVINAPKGAFILNGMMQASTVARTPEAASEYIRKQLDAVLKNREAA